MEEEKYPKDIYVLYDTLLKISEKSPNCEELKKKIEDNKTKIMNELKQNNDYILKRKKY